MLVCFFISHARPRRIERPAFPASSDVQKAGRSWQTSRETCGEIAKPCLCTAGCLKIESVGRWPGEQKSWPSLRGAQATKQSILRLRRRGLLRFARNDEGREADAAHCEGGRFFRGIVATPTFRTQERVGWVERSDTLSIAVHEVDGFI